MAAAVGSHKISKASTDIEQNFCVDCLKQKCVNGTLRAKSFFLAHQTQCSGSVKTEET